MFSTSLKLIPILLLLTSCSWFTKEVEVRTVEVKTPVFQPSRPAGVNLNNIEWYVVSEKNQEDFWNRLKERQNSDPVFFALTPQDYEALSYNVQEIRRVLLEYIALIKYYEDVTKHEPSLEEKENSD